VWEFDHCTLTTGQTLDLNLTTDSNLTTHSNLTSWPGGLVKHDYYWSKLKIFDFGAKI